MIREGREVEMAKKWCRESSENCRDTSSTWKPIECWAQGIKHLTKVHCCEVSEHYEWRKHTFVFIIHDFLICKFTYLSVNMKINPWSTFKIICGHAHSGKKFEPPAHTFPAEGEQGDHLPHFSFQTVNNCSFFLQFIFCHIFQFFPLISVISLPSALLKCCLGSLSTRRQWCSYERNTSILWALLRHEL